MAYFKVDFTEDDYKVYVMITGIEGKDVLPLSDDRSGKNVVGADFIFGTPEEAEKFFMNLLEDLRNFCKNIPGYKKADDQTR